MSTVRGANCFSSNLVNDSDVRAFSYQIDFPRCHFSLHNCHLLKSFACVAPGQAGVGYYVRSRFNGMNQKRKKKRGAVAQRGRFFKCDLAPEQRILFFE